MLVKKQYIQLKIFLFPWLRVRKWNPKLPHFPLVAFFTKCHSTTGPKQPALWEEDRLPDQNRTPYRAVPLMNSDSKTKRGHGLFRDFQIQPPTPIKPNMFCWGYLAKQNKNPNETEFPKKQHLLPASYVSAAAWLSPSLLPATSLLPTASAVAVFTDSLMTGTH